MNRSFSQNKDKMRKELIVLIVIGLILLAVGLFDITLLVLYAGIVGIIFLTSYKEKMVEIKDDAIILHYKKSKEVFELEDIRLMEIEPRKATYRTMGSVKNLHIQSTKNVIQFNVVNIYNEEMNQALKELSEKYDFKYFNEHVDMRNEENNI